MSVLRNTKSNTYPETGGVDEEPTWGRRQRAYSRRPLTRSSDCSNNEWEESAAVIVARAIPSEGPNLTTFNVRKLQRRP